MIAERIELASSKISRVLAKRPREENDERRKALEDSGLAIALAMASLADLKAASLAGRELATREANHAWQRMEAAVREVTGEPAVTVVAPPAVPATSRSLPD